MDGSDPHGAIWIHSLIEGAPSMLQTGGLPVGGPP
jgi:hypothetical protein